MKKFLFKTLNAFFSICNTILTFIAKYPALVILIIITLTITIAILMFRNDTNVGGILGKLFKMLGMGDDLNNIEKSNTIPKNRKQAIGEADEKGYIQHKVDELETSLNPFRDKTKITLPNGKKVDLPQGIKDTDVDTVIESETEVIIIPTESSYKKALEMVEILNKAERSNSSAKDLLKRLKEENA